MALPGDSLQAMAAARNQVITGYGWIVSMDIAQIEVPLPAEDTSRICSASGNTRAFNYMHAIVVFSKRALLRLRGTTTGSTESTHGRITVLPKLAREAVPPAL
ncbi:hypothetical protein HPB50_024105 [Hyalomma asiaticum]|uniref:Uncharacterized protein n=1 Tax=Hyalomma asiaticum TaxID=266040 RepID=A0ACB7S3Y1_HYAAI|nr:hypothetical protein HPB50_024105 [Hyalomma asiaticum]